MPKFDVFDNLGTKIGEIDEPDGGCFAMAGSAAIALFLALGVAILAVLVAIVAVVMTAGLIGGLALSVTNGLFFQGSNEIVGAVGYGSASVLGFEIVALVLGGISLLVSLLIRSGPTARFDWSVSKRKRAVRGVGTVLIFVGLLGSVFTIRSLERSLDTGLMNAMPTASWNDNGTIETESATLGSAGKYAVYVSVYEEYGDGAETCAFEGQVHGPEGEVGPTFEAPGSGVEPALEFTNTPGDYSVAVTVRDGYCEWTVELVPVAFDLNRENLATCRGLSAGDGISCGQSVEDVG